MAPTPPQPQPPHSVPTGLNEERAQTDAIFTSIGDGAIATDEFGRITRCNPAAVAIMGYKESEMIGKWFPKVFVAVNPDGSLMSLIDRPITKAFLTGKSITEKISYRVKSGNIVPMAATVSPIILHGRPVGAIDVFRDITLEYEVDRMKSEFISLASHQLRTPLSAVKTYSHMLVDGYMGPVSPPQRRALRTIIESSNRMNELISTLLNITRIESGSITVTPKQVNLSRLTEEVGKEVRLSADNKSITLDLSLPRHPLLTRTDGLIAKEILSNLVVNAIKYTPEHGTVHISLRGRRYDVLFAVKDNGVGIPQFAQDQIFTKFFRAQNVVQRETTGTGLGLYLVKGLVDVLGGKVWFESIENTGSTFYFTLPRKKSAKATEAAPRRRTKPAAKATTKTTARKR